MIEPQLDTNQQHQHTNNHHGNNLLDASFQSNDTTNEELSSNKLYANEDSLPNPRTSSVSSTSSAFNTSNYSTLSGSNASSIQDNLIRIGYTKCLQIFLYHSSNLLLNRNNLHKDKIKNVSCYVLEIYKMFIRKIKMDHYTWYLKYLNNFFPMKNLINRIYYC
jgi:hypothetical protein